MTNVTILVIISLAIADLAHPVERHLAKVKVASSSLVIRSKNKTPLLSGVFYFSYKGQACLTLFYINKGIGKPIPELYYQSFLGTILSLPPIYIRSASGIETVPSALRLFSRNAMSILGGATTVLLRV